MSKVRGKRKKVVVSLTFDPDVLKGVNRRASQLHRNRSQYFTELHLEAVKAEQPDKAA